MSLANAVGWSVAMGIPYLTDPGNYNESGRILIAVLPTIAPSE